MKKILATLQLAVCAFAGYRNTPNTWTLVKDTSSTSNSIGLNITVENWADEHGDILYMNLCANLKTFNPPDKQTYYWGVLFKPQDPIPETKWDGVTF